MTTRSYRIATYLLGLLLLCIAYALPLLRDSLGLGWGVPLFKGTFADGTALRVHGGALTLCEAATGCIAIPAGRGLGGAQFALSASSFVLQVMLTIGLIQAIRDRQLHRLPLYTVIAVVPYTFALLAVFLLAEAPPGGTLGVSWGLLPAVLALGPIVVAQTNLFEHVTDGPEPYDNLPRAVAVHAPPVVGRTPPVAGRTPAVLTTTTVVAADFGHAGLRVRTDAGEERRIAWTGLHTVALDRSGAPPHLDLVTVHGEALRITPTSQIDYRFLPGGPAPDAAENLRRLEQFARARNPSLI